MMFVSGIVCVWQSGAGGERPQRSSVSVLSGREEAFSPGWTGWDGVIPAACWDASLSAVLAQTASDQLHQVKYFLLYVLSLPAQRRLLTVISHVSFRPLTVSTEEYGTMWLAFSHDTKQNLTLLSDGQESLSATLNVLKKKLQLHVVEIIGEYVYRARYVLKVPG